MARLPRRWDILATTRRNTALDVTVHVVDSAHRENARPASIRRIRATILANRTLKVRRSTIRLCHPCQAASTERLSSAPHLPNLVGVF